MEVAENMSDSNWTASRFFLQRLIEWLVAPVILAIITRLDPTFLVATGKPASLISAYTSSILAYSIFYLFFGYFFAAGVLYWACWKAGSLSKISCSTLCMLFTISYLTISMAAIPHGFFDLMVALVILSLGGLHFVIAFLLSPVQPAKMVAAD